MKKVNVIWKRGGKKLTDHMKKILDMSRLRDDYAKDLDEKGNYDIVVVFDCTHYFTLYYSYNAC